MQHIQKRSGLVGSEIKVDLQETGLNFSFTETPLLKKARTTELFFGYGELGNTKEYQDMVDPWAKNVYINAALILLVIYFISLFSFFKEAATGSAEPWLFWVPILLVIVVYKFFIKEKRIIIKTNTGGYLSLLDNDGGEKIAEEIFKQRRSYLRKRYIEDAETKRILTLETLEYLRSSKVISHDEFEAIKAQNEKKSADVGFVTSQEKTAP